MAGQGGFRHPFKSTSGGTRQAVGAGRPEGGGTVLLEVVGCVDWLNNDGCGGGDRDRDTDAGGVAKRQLELSRLLGDRPLLGRE